VWIPARTPFFKKTAWAGWIANPWPSSRGKKEDGSSGGGAVATDRRAVASWARHVPPTDIVVFVDDRGACSAWQAPRVVARKTGEGKSRGSQIFDITSILNFLFICISRISLHKSHTLMSSNFLVQIFKIYFLRPKAIPWSSGARPETRRRGSGAGSWRPLASARPGIIFLHD